MPISRRKFMIHSAAAAAALALWKAGVIKTEAANLGTGPYQPSWESLAQYECPEWFRDAKFGLWAHWSAQCVPEQGDWYAQRMYEQGNDAYDFHCATYGHPSKVGFKEIDHIWKAENWDPARMIALYKGAGAKYFVALANHHDNLDCYDSAYQPWNTTKVGPMKDIVGTWAVEARKAGLRFGVTVHASHTWNWLEVAQGSDKTGPLAGVPYDGKLTKADGTGLWWDGMDPQALYAQNHAPSGGGWEFEGSNPAPDTSYCEEFYNRTVDLIDKYNPDLLYFDDSGLPLHVVSDVGLRIASHYYNANLQRHGGKMEAVLNTKQLDDQQRKCMVLDYERGKSNDIDPSPWQTDTCIGDWHYRRSIYTNHTYKTPDQVVKMLLDIVSKNGNLLLNIPVRGDGTIDPDEMAFIEGMTAWMKVNEEAIFSSRPWKIPGEGPITLHAGAFSEGGEQALTAKDFRFTTKGNVLYAAAMDWPDDGQLVVRTLSSSDPGLVGKVSKVSLLGAPVPIQWKQTEDGLAVTMPSQKPCDIAFVLKIEGLDLAASMPTPPAAPVTHITADGTTTLTPEMAALSGKIKLQGGDVPNIGYWDNAQDFATWSVHFDQPGTYAVSVKTSAQDGPSILAIAAGGGSAITIPVAKTNSWGDFQIGPAVSLKISAAGDVTLKVGGSDPATWHSVNVAAIAFTRTGD